MELQAEFGLGVQGGGLGLGGNGPAPATSVSAGAWRSAARREHGGRAHATQETGSRVDRGFQVTRNFVYCGSGLQWADG